MKLKGKFYLLFLVSCGLVLGTMGSVIFYHEKRLLYQKLKERGLSLCQTLSFASLNSLVMRDFSGVRLYIDQITKEEDVDYVLVTDPSGRVMVHGDSDKEGLLLYDPISIRAVRATRVVEQSYSIEGKKIYEMAFPIEFASMKWGTVRIGFNLEGINQQLMATTGFFLLLTFTVVGGASFFFLFMGDRIIQPIKRLVIATQEACQGNFSIQIPVIGRDEAGKLSRVFNLMTQALKREKEALEKSNKKAFSYNEKLKRKIKDLWIIGGATRSLREIMDTSKRFELILNIAIYLSKASGGCLFSFSGESSKPLLRVKKGFNINLNLERYTQLSRKAFETRRFTTLAHKYKEAFPGKSDDSSSSRGSDFDLVAYPLKAEDTVWGVLILEKTEGLFTRDELQTLLTFLDEVNLLTENSVLTKIILESQQLDAFNKLSSILVHDLKGAITQLSLSLQNAEKNYYDPRFREDFLATISDSIEKMHRLTERIDERPDSLKLEPCQINQILRDIIEELKLRKCEKVKLQESYEDIPPVLIDSDRIKRVFRNIIVNALEAMPNGGSLWVRSYRKESDSSVYIDVKDSGVGMSQDFIDNYLFKPFNSTKRKGLGLALYSSKEIVNLHGGKIFVESCPGRGTKFTVKLPLLVQHTEKTKARKYLGQYLLDMGAITEEQLKEAIQIQLKDGKKIGNILIDMGYIREKEVLQALQKQKNAERKILETLIKDHL